MSLSNYLDFEHVQATKECDHCGGVNNVEHYCHICDETICLSCKAIHNKARATRNHQVVLREERLTKDKGSTFCKKHPDQKTSLHCDTCNVSVCSKCGTETHNGHKLFDFSTVLQNLKREIEGSRKKMEKRMEKVNALIQKGERNWEDYENKIKSIETQISDAAVCLRSLVDETEENIKHQLNIIMHQDRVTWEMAKDRLDKEKTIISTSLDQHNTCLSSTTTTGMVELLEESNALRGESLYPIEVGPPSYSSPSYISIEGFGEIMKQFKLPPVIRRRKFKIVKAEVILSLKSTLKGWPSICYAGDGHILLGTHQSNDIHTINIKGTIINKRENVLRNSCYSLALTKSKDIVVSDGRFLNILSLQNQLRSLLDHSPYEMRFITVTGEQEILACLCRYLRNPPIYEGRVVLCDDRGGNKRQVGPDGMYGQPIQAISLHDGGFCISDADKQRLVVLNADGNIRHIIERPLCRFFWPYGVCTDKDGNILAADQYNDCVYVIGKDMSVRELVGKTEGIKEPRCLCVDDDNYLWISQCNGKIKAFKYLEVQ